MPAFFVSGLFRLDHKSFAFQITGKPLIRNRQGDNCFHISFVKRQRQRLRRLKTVFLQITQIETVSKEGDPTEIQRERQLIVHFIFADFHTVPVKFLTANGFQADLREKFLQPFPGIFVRSFCGKAENRWKRVTFFAEQGEKMTFAIHFVWKDSDAFLKFFRIKCI